MTEDIIDEIVSLAATQIDAALDICSYNNNII